jgi:hypothetical protein
MVGPLLRLIFSRLHVIRLVALCKLLFFISRSMQGKAVITVHCRGKAMKMTSETKLLVLKIKMIESENYGN